MSVPAFGTSLINSDLAFLLQDQLNAMGDYLTQDVGSLNWIEAYVNARALAADKQYIQLLANQLSPAGATIFLQRWAVMYNTLGLNNEQDIKNYIELKQSQFGTAPTFNNIKQFMQSKLGSIFLDLEWTPELQPLATTDPIQQISEDGYAYASPLSTVMVYVWQPRDNQDNLLMSNAEFNAKVESYRSIMQEWNPSTIEFITMNLTNRGNCDGYGGGYNGLNYNNYLDGYNVVSGVLGTNVITGVNTTFKTYSDGGFGDFQGAVSEGYNPPIQIVDDAGVLRTYFVASVQSNTQLTTTTPILGGITNRTYRTLGFILDTVPMLDNAGLFNF